MSLKTVNMQDEAYAHDSLRHVVANHCVMSSDMDEDVTPLEEEEIAMDLSVNSEMSSVVTHIQLRPINFRTFLTQSGNVTYDDVKANATEMVRRLCPIIDVETQIAEDILHSCRWDMNEAVLQFTAHQDSVSMKSEHDEYKTSTQEAVEELVPMVKKAKEEETAVESSDVKELFPIDISQPEHGPVKYAEMDLSLQVAITEAEAKQIDESDRPRASIVEAPEDEIVAKETTKPEDAVMPINVAHSGDEITSATIAKRSIEETVTMAQGSACRASKALWPHIRGNFACAMCFNERNGYATDCGIVVCAQCWKGYFGAEFSGGVNGLIRCPLPDCNSIVPLWLMQKCYGQHEEIATIILACYRSEFSPDFVYNSEYLQFCPSPKCSKVVQAHPGWTGREVVCQCEYTFCFYCLNEAHFPAACALAKEIASLVARREMQRVAEAFGEIKKCSYCEGLIAGGNDRVKCLSCHSVVSWNSLLSCRESVKKAFCSRFAKRSERVESQVAEIVIDFGNWATTLSQTDRLSCFPDGCVDAETWELFVRQAERAIHFLKWTKLFCLLGLNDEQVERRICQKANTIHRYLQAFATGGCTREILLSIQDFVSNECKELEDFLKSATPKERLDV